MKTAFVVVALALGAVALWASLREQGPQPLGAVERSRLEAALGSAQARHEALAAPFRAAKTQLSTDAGFPPSCVGQAPPRSTRVVDRGQLEALGPVGAGLALADAHRQAEGDFARGQLEQLLARLDGLPGPGGEVLVVASRHEAPTVNGTRFSPGKIEGIAYLLDGPAVACAAAVSARSAPSVEASAGKEEALAEDLQHQVELAVARALGPFDAGR